MDNYLFFILLSAAVDNIVEEAKEICEIENELNEIEEELDLIELYIRKFHF